MPRAAILIAGLSALPCPLAALDLSDAARADFGAEVRALLLDEPEIVRRALEAGQPDAAGIYADEAAADTARLDAEAARLFARTAFGFGAETPDRILVLFLAADCPDCARALDEARILTRTHAGLRVELRAADGSEATALWLRDVTGVAGGAGGPTGPESFAALGLDTAPAYVLPDLMLRGWIPLVVMERYLTD